MAEFIHQFAEPLVDADGHDYAVRVYGAPNDTTWDGWIEFHPLNGGTALQTDRETTQPNRVDLSYWATGLTSVYLEGAFDRALRVEHETEAVGFSPDEPVEPAVGDDYYEAERH